ncbi:ABC transporter ATP-binding protein [Pollutimonas thiosulfatoxidans]|uniref:ABC transporter ATP-binding protein n=1 Tax=Pollutimonas thiosulfatoxidans TaxID=2028345 RepID=UPI0013E2883E|nr:ABC transporter ATP-binding protein [Pollutimonas thiosulfatoxidans]
MDAILETRKLTRKYGDMTALNAVDLTIERGEFIALLGPSGCGKTTLLKCIGGFTDPTSGEILLDGRPMSGMPANKRPVNTVFQSYALFPHMTIADNVAYGPRRARLAKPEVKSQVAEALNMVGLSHLGDKYPSQLSGGQQQRIALARAVINQPRVLLLDEPLGALDLKLRRQMQIELKSLQQRLGITFIFVTHDQEEALVMADRIAVMNAGRIVQFGSGEDIYHRPHNEFVADFVGEANLVDVELRTGEVMLAGSASRIASVDGYDDGAYKLLARPEHLAIGRVEGFPIVFNARVERIIFAGEAFKTFIRLENGCEIALKHWDSEEGGLSGAPEVGKTVLVTLKRRKPHFFKVEVKG